MVASPWNCKSIVWLETSFKTFILSCQFQRITPSIKTMNPPMSPLPISHPPNKELPLGPAEHRLHSHHPLPYHSSGWSQHYTAECLMSRWCPFNSNVLIQLNFWSPQMGVIIMQQGNSSGRKQYVVIIRTCDVGSFRKLSRRHNFKIKKFN